MGNLSGSPTNELNGWPAAQADNEQMQTAVMENLLMKENFVQETKIWACIFLCSQYVFCEC